jgi:hypothetical protein
LNYLNEAREAGQISQLLGFNEPDQAGQANLSVDEVIELWPQLESTQLRLGSPAVAWLNDWIREFMQKATQKKLKVDFIAIHYYRSPNNENVLDELEQYLTDVYEEFQLPIWLTEFGAPDCYTLGWCGQATPLQQNEVDRYVVEVIEMLENHPYVERYAWFVDRPQSGFELSALFTETQKISQTGLIYQSVPEQIVTLKSPFGINDAPVIPVQIPSQVFSQGIYLKMGQNLWGLNGRNLPKY